jgi:hypothetical protein
MLEVWRACDESYKYCLSYIRIQADGEKVEFCATDGRLLVFATYRVPCEAFTHRFLHRDAAKLPANLGGNVTLTDSTIECGGVKCLLEKECPGKFPNTNDIGFKPGYFEMGVEVYAKVFGIARAAKCPSFRTQRLGGCSDLVADSDGVEFRFLVMSMEKP